MIRTVCVTPTSRKTNLRKLADEIRARAKAVGVEVIVKGAPCMLVVEGEETALRAALYTSGDGFNEPMETAT